MPEAGIPTMEHPCCSDMQAVATTHHHHLTLPREEALSLLLLHRLSQRETRGLQPLQRSSFFC